jgi:hypothetical protein
MRPKKDEHAKSYCPGDRKPQEQTGMNREERLSNGIVFGCLRVFTCPIHRRLTDKSECDVGGVERQGGQ